MARKAGMSVGVEVARISVKVSPDTRNFRRELKHTLDEIEARNKLHIEAKLDTAGLGASMRSNMAELQAQAAKGIHVDVEVDLDRNRLQRLASDMSKQLADAGSKAGKSLGSGMQGGISGGPAGIAAIAVGVVGLLAPAVALASTALATLPGLVTAIAAPVAAITLGIDGLKKAAEQLKAPVDHLKVVMSKSAEDTFTPVLAKLKALFPALEAALPSVTQGLGKMADSLASTVTSGDGMRKIIGTIQGIAQGLTNAAPGVGSFASGFLGMAEVLSQKLPGVGKWFSEIGTQFDKWVTKVTSNGQLSTAFDNLGTTLKGIVDLVGSVADKGIELMADPNMASGFKNMLADLKVIVENLLPAGKIAFEAIAGTVGIVRGGIETVKMTIDGLVSAATFLPSKFMELATALGNTNWSALWDGLKVAASTAWESVKSTATEAFSSVVTSVVTAAGSIMAEVGSWPSKIGAALAGLAQAGTEAGKNLVQGLINGISGMIGGAIAKAKELASAVANAAKAALGIHSPSRVFHQLGEYTGEGFANGLESQADRLTSTARSMAESVSDEFQQGLTFGADGFSGGDPAVAGLLNAPIDFANATGKQFMSDLGISGEGFIPRAITEGINYVFNVRSVDEAISLRDREDMKRALGMGLGR